MATINEKSIILQQKTTFFELLANAFNAFLSELLFFKEVCFGVHHHFKGLKARMMDVLTSIRVDCSYYYYSVV